MCLTEELSVTETFDETFDSYDLIQRFHPKQANRAQKRQGVTQMGSESEEWGMTYDSSATARNTID